MRARPTGWPLHPAGKPCWKGHVPTSPTKRCELEMHLDNLSPNSASLASRSPVRMVSSSEEPSKPNCFLRAFITPTAETKTGA